MSGLNPGFEFDKMLSNLIPNHSKYKVVGLKNILGHTKCVCNNGSTVRPCKSAVAKHHFFSFYILYHTILYYIYYQLLVKH